MTNHWIDYQHSDVFMNIGLNTAENHPVSMKWIDKARQEKGAKLICVDPRITRTAAVADIYAPIRPGTNTAFLAGLINYALANEYYHEEYVKHYTNASYLIKEEFSFEDGMFTSPEEVNGDYYQRNENGEIITDPDLEDPNCVFQLLKDHYQRYDLDTVSEITGCPKDSLKEVAKTFCSTGEPAKAGNIMYAMGITQFTHGAQNVRSIAILQLLLGNMGIAGGGVNAQRGQSNVQGSTDMAMLYHIIPGYMGTPSAQLHPTFEDYKEQETPDSGYWENTPKFITSMLKAFWGDYATAGNDYCYDFMPKLDEKDRSHIGMFREMAEGNVEGMICWADNPAVSGPSTAHKRDYMGKLKWMVSIDIFENETAAFWKAPGVDPEEIDTEVFLLPAALHVEREGSISNSGRWIQWRNKAVNPPGEAKSDLEIVDLIYKNIKSKYEAENGVFPEPILNLNWDYGEPADPETVAKEINGFNTITGELIENFTHLQSNGSTASGNWLYCGYYNDHNAPPTKRRHREVQGIGLHPDWSFAWPLNRRVIYNRCAADPKGKPWNPETPLVWYENGQWKTNDVPDFNTDVPPEDTANTPFIMLPEGQGRLFGNVALVDGPFPEHYEPWESPVENIMSSTQFNPHVTEWYPDQRAEIDSEEYPYIATSYRITEHYQTGMMTRNMPWLYETMPDIFVEISKSLADKLGITKGESVEVITPRGKYQAGTCITNRIRPIQVNGRKLEMVGLLWHWGYQGAAKGAVANDVSPSIGDANTTIPEYKAFLCNIRKVNNYD
ncbi:Formate dehydrogenase [Natranaerobius thermophilus JW/NM-WN-LF]|uniref:Formate dehydrogenase n=3 Tax=Natranaerobius TaxID=375928 RepID=B2A1V0_NATTJ|nr:Formate dehydrogenase [Natranaerobius thermophilus JW/NM-WN-LF]